MSLRFNPFTGTLDFDTLPAAGTSPWVTISDTIAASSTQTIDSIINTNFESLKYIVTVFNTANSAYESFEFNVLNNGGAYKDTLTHKLRSGLNVSVDSNNNAGTFELQITNNELYSLQIELAKLILV